MGLRYTIPFKDFSGNSYRVEIYREDYTGEATELTGATSCFVVSGSDEDFVYTPVRTSTATIHVLDSDLLLDLYSINNQYAPVKLYRNEQLEWTGYIKPEQYTQPYSPNPQNIGVECVCAVATLEHIEYKAQTSSGYITMRALLQYLISSANGGYKGVYIPNVYGSTAEMTTDFMDDVILCEENFTSSENNLLEVMQSVCKFLNWTLHDIGGYLYFIDADWDGMYRMYESTLSGYVEESVNAATLQDIGFNGGGNTLDVVPGYNKASVKSINNVFAEVIQEESFDSLEVVQTWNFDEGDFEGARRCIRKYKVPKTWEMFYYDNDMNALSIDEIKSMEINSDVVGSVIMTENAYKVTEDNGEWVPDVSEYDWVDMLRVKFDYNNNVLNAGDDTYKAFTVKGVNSVWRDGAIGLYMQIKYASGTDLVDVPNTVIATYYYFMLRIGDKYWNGSAWTTTYSLFRVYHNALTSSGFQQIESNLNADMPYRGLRGHVIELPTDEVLRGELEFTMFMNHPGDSQVSGYFIKDFELDYVKMDGVDDEGEDGDRLYENIVNESYMSECDEITFEIGSYNADGATYSKALLNDAFLTDNLYCAIVDDFIRPEELLIRRIVNRYGETKLKLTESIKISESIKPFTILSDNSMVGKKFLLTSGEWDYEQNRLTVQMQEDTDE